MRIAQAALGTDAVVQGDIRNVDLPACDAIVILDVLLYLSRNEQAAMLARCADALAPGGLLLLREADADGGLPFQVTRWTEQVASAARGRWRQPLTYRATAEWSTLLADLGFDTEALPMSQGTPFANTLFIGRRSNASVQICPSGHEFPNASISPEMKPQTTARPAQRS